VLIVAYGLLLVGSLRRSRALDRELSHKALAQAV